MPHKTNGIIAPWAALGWQTQAETWISSEMTRLGASVDTIQLIRKWCISVVLRVETTTYPVIFKASLKLPLFVNEGDVMTGLAQLYPAHVPAPLAVDTRRNWMLLEYLGQPVGRDATLEQKVDLFRAFSSIHVDSTNRIDRLIQMGCIDRRIPWLKAHLDALMADEVTLSNLTDVERDDLRIALPLLQSLLDELDSLPIPPSLIHGDLHTGNVAIREGKFQIFDWTDAAISHPFFDLDVVFSTEDPTARKALEQAYLAGWEQLYPPAQVRRAFEFARAVYGLYHAVSYQFILNNLEEADRSEINSAHYFLRQVLAGLKNMRG